MSGGAENHSDPDEYWRNFDDDLTDFSQVAPGWKSPTLSSPSKISASQSRPWSSTFTSMPGTYNDRHVEEQQVYEALMDTDDENDQKPPATRTVPGMARTESSSSTWSLVDADVSSWPGRKRTLDFPDSPATIPPDTPATPSPSKVRKTAASQPSPTSPTPLGSRALARGGSGSFTVGTSTSTKHSYQSPQPIPFVLSPRRVAGPSASVRGTLQDDNPFRSPIPPAGHVAKKQSTFVQSPVAEDDNPFKVPSSRTPFSVDKGKARAMDTNSSSSTFKPPPEVIVIDSDSDDDMYVDVKPLPSASRPVSPSKPPPAATRTSLATRTQSMPSNVFSASRNAGATTSGASVSAPPRQRLQSSPTQPTSPESINIISHDRRVQQMMDGKRIAWGVQYELARGVQRGLWKYADITEDLLNKLKGTNTEKAPLVAQVMREDRYKKAVDANNPVWSELDREQAAIIEGRGRGLGCFGPADELWCGEKNWYGGKVQQGAELIMNDSREFEIRLLKFEKKKSSMMSRFLGSRRIIRVKLSKINLFAQHENAAIWLTRPHVLCGRTFRSIFHKDGAVFLVETPEDYERSSMKDFGDQYRMPLKDIINWYNPPELNTRQAVRKWVERFSLAFSTTIPVFEFQPDEIEFIEDEVAENISDPSPEHIKTDGCGFINGAALTKIGKACLNTRPAGIQGRVCGAKGFWILHPEDQEENAKPRIWVRNSQKKVNLPPLQTLGREHCIFNLVAPTRVSNVRLNRQVILNLSHNGVPDELFAQLLEQGLKEDVEQFLNWEHPEASVLLAQNVQAVGAVVRTRVMRQAGGLSRAMGLTGRDWAEEYGKDDNPADDWDVPTGMDDDGEPATLHEAVLLLVNAGFRPNACRALFDKLRLLVQHIADRYIKEGHIPVARARDAYMAPDPTGRLKKGQIFFWSAKAMQDPDTLVEFNCLMGKVLMYRNMSRVPSDIQEVTAVDIPELHKWPDIIFYSTEGDISFASLLAGGDADGDTAVVVWEPKLVDKFIAPPPTQMPPNFLEDNFKRNVQKVGEFLELGCKTFGNNISDQYFQTSLVIGLKLPPTGRYSVFHENALFVHGYSHPAAVRLGYMFNTVLDSVKSGLEVREQVWIQDRDAWDREQPECLAPRSLFGSPPRLPPRDTGLPPFVLDSLAKAGRELVHVLIKDYDKLGVQYQVDTPDEDLLRPYRDAQSLEVYTGFPEVHAAWKAELGQMMVFVETKQRQFNAITGSLKSGSSYATSPTKSPTKGKRSRQPGGHDKYEELRREWATGPDVELPLLRSRNLSAIMASYAYSLCSLGRRPGQKESSFAWSVAGRTLREIKAQACGQMALTLHIGNTMSVSTSVARIYRHQVPGEA